MVRSYGERGAESGAGCCFGACARKGRRMVAVGARGEEGTPRGIGAKEECWWEGRGWKRSAIRKPHARSGGARRRDGVRSARGGARRAPRTARGGTQGDAEITERREKACGGLGRGGGRKGARRVGTGRGDEKACGGLGRGGREKGCRESRRRSVWRSEPRRRLDFAARVLSLLLSTLTPPPGRRSRRAGRRGSTPWGGRRGPSWPRPRRRRPAGWRQTGGRAGCR